VHNALRPANKRFFSSLDVTTFTPNQAPKSSEKVLVRDITSLVYSEGNRHGVIPCHSQHLLPPIGLPPFARMPDGVCTLEEFRKRLGPFAAKYTDAELEQLEREMASMAQLLLDLYSADKEKGGQLDAGLPRRKMGGKGRNLKTKPRG
jgi:hypothetical protein